MTPCRSGSDGQAEPRGSAAAIPSNTMRDFLERFDEARELARTYGRRLVDWFACDDYFRLTIRYIPYS